MHFLAPILSLASQHAHLAYLVVFLAAFAESLALAGLVVPGRIIVFASGAVVATGHLALLPVLSMAIAGAIAGDGLSYWLGYHYRERLKSHWPFSRYPDLLAEGEALFIRHDGKSVLFGRFVGVVRSVVPLVAGMMAMTPSHFFIANVLSAMGWGMLHVLPGVVFGASLAMAGAVSARLAVLALLLCFGIWALFWICRRIVLAARQLGQSWIPGLQRWAEGAPSGKRLLSLGQRALARLLSPGRNTGGPVIFLGALALATGAGFAAVAQDVLVKDPLVLVDQSVNHFFQGLRSSWADVFFVAVTELGDSFVNTSLVIAIFIVLFVLRLRRTALFWLLAAVGGSLGMQFLKWFFQRPRPISLYEGISALSFPSGHTTMSMVVYGFLAIILARNLTGMRQWLLFSSALVITFLIGFSRLYLGIHWFSDVLGGTLAGISWVALMGIVWLRHTDEHIPRRLLIVTVLAVHGTAGAWHVMQKHGQDLHLYAPHQIAQNLEQKTWQDSAWQELPAARLDMEGRLEQPLSIQWAGQIGEIRQLLTSQGWREPPAFGLHSLLSMLIPDAPIAELPVFPQLHGGREESLLMVRNTGNTRLVLRLWDDDIIITPTKRPLFLGCLEEQHTKKFGRLLSFPHADAHAEKPLHVLAEELRGAVFVQAIRAVRREAASSSPVQYENPNGRQERVLLILQAGP